MVRTPRRHPRSRHATCVELLEARQLLSTTVSSFLVNGGDAQRSTVTSIGVRFNVNVAASVASDDLVLWNATTGAFVDTAGATVSYDLNTHTATWRFPNQPGGTLPDGNYRATLKAMSIHDVPGQPLDGDGSGVGGDDPTFTFFRYYGSVDGDRDVDNLDLFAFRLTSGKTSPDPAYDARFDADADGDVDNLDLFKYRANSGKTLAAPTGNTPPSGPVITEPEFDGQVVSGQDVHMEAPGFIDPDAGQTHAKSDWEIWTTGPNPVRVWSAVGVTTAEDRVHIHFGQGTFEGPAAAVRRLVGNAEYRLRTRHHDSSGDPGTAGGAWSVRLFRTMPDDLPSAVNWTLDRPGFKVEEVPFTFDLPGSTPAERQFRMPTAITFVPNPTGHANDVLFYVADLYGTIWSVTHNYTVRLYADGLLNFNPSGRFAGDGETGLTGITVDPANGDVYATMLFDATPGVDAGNPGLTDDTFPKVTRFTSANGGVSAVDTNPGAVGTQGTDVLVIQSTADSPEFQLQSHIISNISFGPDGKLYVHNGEGFAAEYARNVNSFRGKVLRMNKDGTAPADNPFYNAADRLLDGQPDAADYVYAMGFRNPFGGAWNPADGQHYQVENGPTSNDRMSKVRRGVDYGWTGSSASMTTNALYNWANVIAPVNIEFLDPNRFGGSGFPAYLQGKAFVTESGGAWSAGADGGRKRLNVFDINGDANNDGNPANDNGALRAAPFSLVRYTGAGRSSFIGLDQGPDGMYFTTLYEETGASGPTGRGGKVMRVVYAGVADFTVNPAGGPAAPLTVQFTDKSDVPGATAWLWNFGDGTTSTLRNPSRVYARAGSFDVTLTVTGARGPVTVNKFAAVTVGTPDVGTGLRATYWDNLDFTGANVTRIDPTVDFDWGSGSPHPSIGAEEFSSRWAGRVMPEFTQAYTFYTQTNDGARLWINGVQVINDWQNQALTENATAPIMLQAGVKYTIVMEHYEHVNTAVARLLWSSASTPKQVIPQSRLYAAALDASVPPTGPVLTPDIRRVRQGWGTPIVSATSNVTGRDPYAASTAAPQTPQVATPAATVPGDAAVARVTRPAVSAGLATAPPVTATTGAAGPLATRNEVRTSLAAEVAALLDARREARSTRSALP